MKDGWSVPRCFERRTFGGEALSRDSCAQALFARMILRSAFAKLFPAKPLAAIIHLELPGDMF